MEELVNKMAKLIKERSEAQQIQIFEKISSFDYYQHQD
jgi:hypothetical protein